MLKRLHPQQRLLLGMTLLLVMLGLTACGSGVCSRPGQSCRGHCQTKRERSWSAPMAAPWQRRIHWA